MTTTPFQRMELVTKLRSVTMQRANPFIGCHNWMVDNSLLKKDFADLRYVNTCIEVRRVMKRTGSTMKSTFIPVGFICEPAFTTSLRSISWINKNNRFPNIFSFISEELSELKVCPIASHS